MYCNFKNYSVLTGEDMETNNTDPKSFWHTLPGIITASAGAITAITGLVIALSNLGISPKGNGNSDDENLNSQGVVEIAETQTDAATRLEKKEPGAKLRSIEFSADEIRVSNELRYEILDSVVEPMSPGRSLMRIKIRCFNDRDYPFNFWTASFRLAVDDIPTAPINDLNELVDGRAAKDGYVEFEFPDEAKSLLFLIYDGDRKIEIPITAKGT